MMLALLSVGRDSKRSWRRSLEHQERKMTRLGAEKKKKKLVGAVKAQVVSWLVLGKP